MHDRSLRRINALAADGVLSPSDEDIPSLLSHRLACDAATMALESSAG